MSSYYAGHKDLNLLNPEAHIVFRKLAEDIKIGIFMADALDRLFYVNRAFVETLELHSSSEALGRNWGETCFSDAKESREFFVKLNTLVGVKDFELTHILPCGLKIYLLVTANNIYSDQGEKIGLQGYLTNISDRRRLEEDLSAKHRKLEQILNFCNTLGDVFDIQELTKYIVHQTAQILEARRCSLMLVDEASNELYVGASFGLHEHLAPKGRVRIGDPVAGIIALQTQAVLVENIEDHDLFKRQNKKIYTQTSFMSSPLFYNKKLMGVLSVSEKQGRFSKIDLKVLETIAHQSAVNINKIQMLNAFEHLSQTDPMTGLLNYRSFVQKLEEEIQRAVRYQTHLSLVMVDIDNFKIYNDTHGHPEGDWLLKRVAEIFRSNLRASELICRYGGDEFAIIFPQTDAAQAAIAADKVRDLIAQEFLKKNVTISVGVSQFKTGSGREQLIKHADQSLYQSKRSGRNKVSLNYGS